MRLDWKKIKKFDCQPCWYTLCIRIKNDNRACGYLWVSLGHSPRMSDLKSFFGDAPISGDYKVIRTTDNKDCVADALSALNTLEHACHETK